MKAHINNKEYEKIIKEKFDAVYIKGLSVGTKTVAKVILDMINSDKSESEKIADIKGFCERGLDNKDTE